MAKTPDPHAVYEAFDRALRGLTAYAIVTEKGESSGRVVFKRMPASGTVHCFLQLWGGPMVRHKASGGGYDKHGAALRNAIGKLQPQENQCPAYDRDRFRLLRAREASRGSMDLNRLIEKARDKGLVFHRVTG